ncbi:MAG: glycosyltransferase [Microthrixaceae bacterium]
MPLRVVIIHWNQAQSCAETVARFLADQLQVRVTVIDNGSSSEQLAALRSGLAALGDSAVTLVETGRNLGFGPGANVGLRLFLGDPNDGDWVVVAPHDVDPAPDCLSEMLRIAEAEPMAGLMCADVGDGMTPVIDPYFGGMVVPSLLPITSTPRWEEVDYPHGTLMMLKRDCLEESGIFDERYFSYCEEADLGIRVRRAGWRVGLIRGAKVTNMHIGSGVRLVDYLQTRNTLLLVQENSGWYHAFIRAVITVEQVIRGVVSPASRPLIFDPTARLKGLRDFALRRFGPPPSHL